MLFPVEFAEDLLREFYPDHTIARKDRLIVIAAAKANARIRSPGKSRPASGRAEPPPVRDRSGFIISDAGHGGKDPGAIGRGGLHEKTITLSVARRLESHLKANLKGVRIVLTRNSDTFIELATRTRIANAHLRENENGVFISIHVNASISPAYRVSRPITSRRTLPMKRHAPPRRSKTTWWCLRKNRTVKAMTI